MVTLEKPYVKEDSVIAKNPSMYVFYNNKKKSQLHITYKEKEGI